MKIAMLMFPHQLPDTLWLYFLWFLTLSIFRWGLIKVKMFVNLIVSHQAWFPYDRYDHCDRCDLWEKNSAVAAIIAIIWGAFHYAKISGNFGPNVNGTVRPRRKSSVQSGPPPEVVLFDRSVRSDRKLPFHFQKFSFPVPLRQNGGWFRCKCLRG